MLIIMSEPCNNSKELILNDRIICKITNKAIVMIDKTKANHDTKPFLTARSEFLVLVMLFGSLDMALQIS